MFHDNSCSTSCVRSTFMSSKQHVRWFQRSALWCTPVSLIFMYHTAGRLQWIYITVATFTTNMIATWSSWSGWEVPWLFLIVSHASKNSTRIVKNIFSSFIVIPSKHHRFPRSFNNALFSEQSQNSISNFFQTTLIQWRNAQKLLTPSSTIRLQKMYCSINHFYPSSLICSILS